MPSPSEEEISIFFQDLSRTGKPALLSIIPEYSDTYVVDHSVMSEPLSALFSEEYMDLSYDILLQKCESVYNALKSLKSKPETLRLLHVTKRVLRNGFVIELEG